MFTYTFDRNKAKTNDHDNVPAGEYDAVVEEVVDRVSGKGNDYWHMTLTITKGDYARRKLFYNLIPGTSFGDQAIISMFDGARREIPQPLTSRSFVGLKVRAKTKLETYDGKERTAVEYFIADVPQDEAAPDDVPF